MKLNRYKGSTCHEVGYRWSIDAPKELTQDDIELVMKVLIDYTDTPSNYELKDMLADKYYMEDLKEELPNTVTKSMLNSISIYTKVVHRDSFMNELNIEV